MFIVFEGVEGSGKSTQAARLSAWLGRLGIGHVLTREPGGTALGEEIRRVLLHSGAVPDRSELLLVLAARAAFVEQVVRPALARGDVVISDRYELSSLAYQGHGRGLRLDQVRRVNAFATGYLRPDVTILLDVDPQEGAARRSRAGLGSDRIERAGDEFHDAVGRAYRLLSESEPGISVVSGAGPADAVEQRVRSLLHERFPETFPAGQG
ncbi:MAG TPA: dTMP kinase [Longimicrobiales bacterium]